ncbi:MAG: 3-dehydroquinate synthase [Bacteroidales bacterium]|nr:3-dehydroquinate synthase [Bacteroidales bacterium]
MLNLELNTSSGHSRIYVSESMANLRNFVDPERTVLLVDENVLHFHKNKLAGFKYIEVPESERSKSIEFYTSVFGKLLELGVDRSWKIVGIGGGVTTDLAGFVASTYFRGLSFGFVSTTLLGQVDASVGGKNGINFEGYKNLLGTIRQPEFVICDVKSLETLPLTEYTDGFAEIIKYGFIKNPEISDYLEVNIEQAFNKDKEVLEKLVFDSVKVKVDIVQSDENESGERKILNFGHTFGHAIEKLHGISHGQSVSLGMILAARMSVNLGLINSGIVDKLSGLLDKCGLPVTADFDIDTMAEVMMKDKKKAGNIMQFIVLEAEGKAIVYKLKLTDLKSILNDLC